MKFKNKLSGFLQRGLKGQNQISDINFFCFKIAPKNTNNTPLYQLRSTYGKNDSIFDTGFLGTKKYKLQKKLFNIKNFFY